MTRPHRIGRALVPLGFALALPLSALAQDPDPVFDDDVADDTAFEDTMFDDTGFEDDFDDDGFEAGDPLGAPYFEPFVRSARGEVDRIDLGEGRVVIDGRTYRADPRGLEGLRPGQQVSLLYEPIDGQAWITELQPDFGSFFRNDPLWGPGY